MIDDRTQDALKQMTVKQSRRWRLKLAGYNNVDIANAEGISPAAVHYSIESGRKRAKRKIEDLILI
jgi:DNA-binding CsgD family transcriptional regulator